MNIITEDSPFEIGREMILISENNMDINNWQNLIDQTILYYQLKDNVPYTKTLIELSDQQLTRIEKLRAENKAQQLEKVSEIIIQAEDAQKKSTAISICYLTELIKYHGQKIPNVVESMFHQVYKQSKHEDDGEKRQILVECVRECAKHLRTPLNQHQQDSLVKQINKQCDSYLPVYLELVKKKLISFGPGIEQQQQMIQLISGLEKNEQLVVELITEIMQQQQGSSMVDRLKFLKPLVSEALFKKCIDCLVTSVDEVLIRAIIGEFELTEIKLCISSQLLQLLIINNQQTYPSTQFMQFLNSQLSRQPINQQPLQPLTEVLMKRYSQAIIDANQQSIEYNRELIRLISQSITVFSQWQLQQQLLIMNCCQMQSIIIDDDVDNVKLQSIVITFEELLNIPSNSKLYLPIEQLQKLFLQIQDSFIKKSQNISLQLCGWELLNSVIDCLQIDSELILLLLLNNTENLCFCVIFAKLVLVNVIKSNNQSKIQSIIQQLFNSYISLINSNKEFCECCKLSGVTYDSIEAILKVLLSKQSAKQPMNASPFALIKNPELIGQLLKRHPNDYQLAYLQQLRQQLTVNDYILVLLQLTLPIDHKQIVHLMDECSLSPESIDFLHQLTSRNKSQALFQQLLMIIQQELRNASKRATAAYLLSATTVQHSVAIDVLQQLIVDKSSLVQEYSLKSLIKLLNNCPPTAVNVGELLSRCLMILNDYSCSVDLSVQQLLLQLLQLVGPELTQVLQNKFQVLLVLLNTSINDIHFQIYEQLILYSANRLKPLVSINQLITNQLQMSQSIILYWLVIVQLKQSIPIHQLLQIKPSNDADHAKLISLLQMSINPESIVDLLQHQLKQQSINAIELLVDLLLSQPQSLSADQSQVLINSCFMIVSMQNLPSSLRHKGLLLLSDIITHLAPVPDPHVPELSVLEQFQAQIYSQLFIAWNSELFPLQTSSIDVFSSFIKSRVVTEFKNHQRLFSALVKQLFVLKEDRQLMFLFEVKLIDKLLLFFLHCFQLFPVETLQIVTADSMTMDYDDILLLLSATQPSISVLQRLIQLEKKSDLILLLILSQISKCVLQFSNATNGQIILQLTVQVLSAYPNSTYIFNCWFNTLFEHFKSCVDFDQTLLLLLTVLCSKLMKSINCNDFVQHLIINTSNDVFVQSLKSVYLSAVKQEYPQMQLFIIRNLLLNINPYSLVVSLELLQYVDLKRQYVTLSLLIPLLFHNDQLLAITLMYLLQNNQQIFKSLVQIMDERSKIRIQNVLIQKQQQ